jgi:hypothetical protein
MDVRVEIKKGHTTCDTDTFHDMTTTTYAFENYGFEQAEVDHLGGNTYRLVVNGLLP